MWGARFEPKSLTGKPNSSVSWSVRILLDKTKNTESCVVFEDVVLVAFCSRLGWPPSRMILKVKSFAKGNFQAASFELLWLHGPMKKLENGYGRLGRQLQ